MRAFFVLLATAALAAACVNVGPATTASPSGLPTLPVTTPSVTLPPTATPSFVPTTAPTLPPTAAPTEAPTDTPTNAPTDTPTEAPTDTPTEAPTDTPTGAPTAAPSGTTGTLDFSKDANYGSIDLSSGFVPDPHQRDITAGGSVDVSYLGSDCSGYATSAPDYKVQYTSGAATLLRFYYLAEEGDTTLIINAPNGSWLCSDDSFGTSDPSIDFESPATGRYDIWVGTYAQGGSIGGALQVTELESNHP